MDETRKPQVTELLILGAGGHAKVVVSTAQAAGLMVRGVLDDDDSKAGQFVFGVPVIGNVADLAHNVDGNCVIGIGDNRSRIRLYEKWQWRRVRWRSVIHPSAFVDASAKIGEGSVVLAGAIVQVDSRIGDHCIVNTGVSVDHDCVIGDFVHLAPGCRLAGNVTVQDGAFLGTGSAVIPGVTIGKNAVVGAGAVVLSDVPSDTTVVGVPARGIRRTEVESRKKGREIGRQKEGA